MNKTLQIIAALFGAALLSAQAVAADSTYVRASAAWFEPAEDNGFDGELGTLVTVGREFGMHNVEIEVGYVEFSETQGPISADLEIVPLTLGYRYDFVVTDKLTLGLGANTGIAFTDLSVSTPFGSASDEDSAWIVSGGVRANYAVTEAVSLSAGYRYVYIDELEYFGGLTLDDADTHVFELGVEFRW